MAVLTWRNVDAPSDRGNSAVSGLTAAARLFDGGASGLGDAIGRFGQQQTDLANNAAVQAASRFQSSDAMKAALADGSLFAGLQGVDPSRVDAKTTGMLNSRVGDLLANTTTELNNDSTRQLMDVRGEKLQEDKYAFGRTQDQNTNTDAARQAYGQYLAARTSGQTGAANQIWSDNADVFSKLTPEQQNELLKGGQSLNQGRLNADSTSISNATNQFGLDVRQRDDRAQQGALQVMDSLKDAASGGEAYQQYNRISQSLDPQVAASVRQQLEQRWGPIFGGNSGAVGSGTGGIASPGSGVNAALASGAGGLSSLGGAPLEMGDPGTFNGGKYDVTFGGRKTDVPITSMSINDLYKLQDQMINDPTLKNSPLGAYQINKDTLKDFAGRLKIDPNTKFTPEVQEQIAEAIFNDRKNGVLGKTWEGLKTKNVPGAMDKGAFKDKSWAEMKDLIAQTEGTAGAETAQDVRNEGKTLSDSLSNLKLAQGQKIQLNQANGVEKALAVTRTGDAGSEASNLIANVPAFKGADAGWLTDEINTVAKRGNMTAPQAATLIQQHLKSNQGTLANVVDKFRTLGGLTDGFTGTDASPNLPSGQRINDKALLAAADSNAQGGGVAQLGQTQGMVATQAQIDQASAALQQAQEQLINARQRAIANPRWGGLKDAQRVYNQTVAQARLLLASASNNAPVNLPPGYNDQAARRAAASVR